MGTLATTQSDSADNSLLIVDDDKPFLTRLAKAMEARGYQVRTAETLEAGKAAIRQIGSGLCGRGHAPRRWQRA